MTAPDVTVSDLPLPPATGDSAMRRPLRARVSARARARVAATARSRKGGSWVLRVAVTVRGDARRWWLVAARPVSLKAWLRTLRPDAARVPDGSKGLRVAWTVDNCSTGVVFRLVGTLLYLAAGAAVWLGAHPLRRWSTMLTLIVFAVWLLLG